MRQLLLATSRSSQDGASIDYSNVAPFLPLLTLILSFPSRPALFLPVPPHTPRLEQPNLNLLKGDVLGPPTAAAQ